MLFVSTAESFSKCHHTNPAAAACMTFSGKAVSSSHFAFSLHYIVILLSVHTMIEQEQNSTALGTLLKLEQLTIGCLCCSVPCYALCALHVLTNSFLLSRRHYKMSLPFNILCYALCFIQQMTHLACKEEEKGLGAQLIYSVILQYIIKYNACVCQARFGYIY